MESFIPLKELGLNQKEIDIYLGLLEFGEAKLTDISNYTFISRTSLYTPIKNLINKGIVEFYKRNGRNYYIAITPDQFLKLEKNKLDLLEKTLLQLKSKANNKSTIPKIKFFEGKDGVKLLLREILNEKRSFSAVTSIEDMNKIAQNYFEDFIKNRIKTNLHVNLLTNRSQEAINLKNKDGEELRETRFVPAKYNFKTANYIFGSKVAIISLTQQPIIGILIEDEAIAQTQQMYFDLIWKMASSK